MSMELGDRVGKNKVTTSSNPFKYKRVKTDDELIVELESRGYVCIKKTREE